MEAKDPEALASRLSARWLKGREILSKEGKIIIKRKTQNILALMVTSVLLFHNCATIISGTTQKIPVTSNPAGAKIIVNGKEMGYAPLNLKLSRGKSHIIRIEKQGYNPFEIRIRFRETSSSLEADIGNGILICIGMVLGIYAGTSLWELSEGVWEIGAGMFVGATLVWLGVKYVDSISGAIYTLFPEEIDVTLSKKEVKSKPNFILIDTEHFQNIKWIRIKYADSDEKEIVKID